MVAQAITTPDIPAADPAPAAAAAMATTADPFAVPDDAAPAQSRLDAMVGRARRDAGIVDRELRAGKTGVPAVAGTPWGSFRTALDGAHKDTARGLTSESYTAPDGQVIYRFRLGGKVWCRTGGSVRPSIGGAVGGGATLFDSRGGEGSAGGIACPSHADWKRD
ncbi:hypothetical protein [Massilia consociata]|uniref:Uncharacterized protein n=1 Tax=Massilia consociata TaxID=760117 RepID=A0ABV6FF31_9BURK